MDRLLGTIDFVAAEQQGGDDERAGLAAGVGQDQLPGETVPVLDPAIAWAERIGIQGHQNITAVT